MSNYRDEHGAEVPYNPALRGGPGSTGEALFRTYLIETLLAISADMARIAKALDPEPLVMSERQTMDGERHSDTTGQPVVRPPEFVLCAHEQVIHVGGIVSGGPGNED